MDVKLTHSTGGGGGNSPPFAKNEGGGIVLSVQKDGRGNVHPLLYCRRGNALTLPKIGGESSYLPDLSRGGNVQGGKCPDTKTSSYRKFQKTHPNLPYPILSYPPHPPTHPTSPNPTHTLIFHNTSKASVYLPYPNLIEYGP